MSHLCLLKISPKYSLYSSYDLKNECEILLKHFCKVLEKIFDKTFNKKSKQSIHLGA